MYCIIYFVLQGLQEMEMHGESAAFLSNAVTKNLHIINNLRMHSYGKLGQKITRKRRWWTQRVRKQLSDAAHPKIRPDSGSIKLGQVQRPNSWVHPSSPVIGENYHWKTNYDIAVWGSADATADLLEEQRDSVRHLRQSPWQEYLQTFLCSEIGWERLHFALSMPLSQAFWSGLAGSGFTEGADFVTRPADRNTAERRSLVPHGPHTLPSLTIVHL